MSLGGRLTSKLLRTVRRVFIIVKKIRSLEPVMISGLDIGIIGVIGIIGIIRIIRDHHNTCYYRHWSICKIP